MIRTVLLLILSIVTIVAMTMILSWFFRRLSRIQEEHWKHMAGESTPRWARFLVGKKRQNLPAGQGGPTDETEIG
jgi:hypothetical protein